SDHAARYLFKLSANMAIGRVKVLNTRQGALGDLFFYSGKLFIQVIGECYVDSQTDMASRILCPLIFQYQVNAVDVIVELRSFYTATVWHPLGFVQSA